jgi:pyruvate/2-oxoacid:ferredoxin oxidoreductase beta subunit
MGEDMAPKASVLAVETNIFPLYEIEDGLFYTINHHSRGLPVENYLSLQGRYKHLTPEEIREIQAEAKRSWEDLQGKAEKGKNARRPTV